MKKILIFSCVLLVFVLNTTFAQKPFVFQNKSVTSGTKNHFEIPVISQKDSTVIPVTIFSTVQNRDLF